MGFDRASLITVFKKTDGHCNICGKKLCRNNYGQLGSRGCWEIEHSIPQALGGSDHLNNLFAACIPCNRAKGTYSSRTARAWNGRTRASLSAERKEEIRTTRALVGAGLGALALAATGPAGWFWGAVLGGLIGNATAPTE